MTELKVPDDYRCPITALVMKDPVLTETGITYERQAIERWLDEHKNDPKTMQLVSNKLVPNVVLRNMIDEWCEAYQFAERYQPESESIKPKIAKPHKCHVDEDDYVQVISYSSGTGAAYRCVGIVLLVLLAFFFMTLFISIIPNERKGPDSKQKENYDDLGRWRAEQRRHRAQHRASEYRIDERGMAWEVPISSNAYRLDDADFLKDKK